MLNNSNLCIYRFFIFYCSFTSHTVHSLVNLLALFEHIKLIFISPVGLEMPANIIQDISKTKASIQPIFNMSLEEAVKISNVLYVTRIQRERFDHDVSSTANSVYLTRFYFCVIFIMFRRTTIESWAYIVSTQS